MSMECFLFYRLATGEIITAVTAQAKGAAALQQPGPGMGVLVIDPGIYDLWNDESVEARAIFTDGVRSAVWEGVKAERARQRLLPLAVSFGTLELDEASRSALLTMATAATAVLAIGGTMAFQVTLADNTTADVDAEVLAQAFAAIAARDDAQHAYSQELRGLIDDPASTLADLLKIDFNSGWPE